MRAESGEAARVFPAGAFGAQARAALAATLCCAAMFETCPARAAEVEIEGQTAADGYEVASPWGGTMLERRRLLQTVSFAVYDLRGNWEPGEPVYSIALRMRLGADFGTDIEQATSFEAAGGSRFLPGYAQAPIDVMYGYVEGRDLAGGWLGFRLGRQYIVDVLGWWSFDGALVRLTTPVYLQLEVYGGLEQRGGLPLSTSRFERQGIWRGSHADFARGSGSPMATDYPSYQYAQPAPAFGIAAETVGPSFVHGRFDYRRVYNLGTSITQQFPDPSGGYRTAKGERLSQERLGYAADIEKDDLGGLRGGFTYDLYGQLVGSFYAGAEAYVGKVVTFGADADYFVPTFDADSIWNWFTKSPVTTVTARTTLKVTPELAVSGTAGVRLWQADGDPDTFGEEQCAAAGQPAGCRGALELDPTTEAVRQVSRDEGRREPTVSPDALASLSARYLWRTAHLGARAMLEAGERGRRTGGELDGEKRFASGRYALGARVSVYDWTDPLRSWHDPAVGTSSDRDATSFGYVLGAGYKPDPIADIHIEWEHATNRLVGQRYRVLALANVWVSR